MSGPNPQRLVQSQAIGEMVHLMARSPLYGRYPLVAVRLYIEPAILVEQYRIYYDGSGRPVGYVTWAHLAEDVHRRLSVDNQYILKLSEWTEGPYFWIRDFLTLPGYARNVAKRALGELRPDAPIYFHRRRTGAFARLCAQRAMSRGIDE